MAILSIHGEVIRDGRLKAKFENMTIDEIRAYRPPSRRHADGSEYFIDVERDATEEVRDAILTLADAGIENAQQARWLHGEVWRLGDAWYQVYINRSNGVFARRAVLRLLPGGMIPAPWTGEREREMTIFETTDMASLDYV